MAYQSNAVDVLGSLLAIGPAFRADRDRRDRQMKEGIEGLATAGGQVYGYVRRKGLTYKGDEYLEKLKAELADLEQEKVTIENQIRTIKAEDLGSLDVFVDEGSSSPSDLTNANPVDYDDMPVDGQRTFPLNANVPFKPGLKALGGI